MLETVFGDVVGNFIRSYFNRNFSFNDSFYGCRAGLYRRTVCRWLVHVACVDRLCRRVVLAGYVGTTAGSGVFMISE